MKSGKQLTIDGLLAIGYEEVDGSSKYRIFTRDAEPQGYDAMRFLVGNSGALRRTDSTIAASRSLTNGHFHKCLKLIGSRHESYNSCEQARRDLSWELDK